MLEENLTCSKLSNSSTENNGGYSPLISKLFNASKYMSSLKSGAWIKQHDFQIKITPPLKEIISHLNGKLFEQKDFLTVKLILIS